LATLLILPGADAMEHSVAINLEDSRKSRATGAGPVSEAEAAVAAGVAAAEVAAEVVEEAAAVDVAAAGGDDASWRFGSQISSQ
jgi:hypothetical protein